MPGYGILGPDEGTGLLPWSWADEQLRASHDYWLATAWPDGRPHVMPVWATWDGTALWFSAGLGSRKARNLARDDRCSATTDDARNPVVLAGRAELVADDAGRQAFLDAVNAKYATDYALDFLDPAVNGCWRVRPQTAVALREDDFSGSPTRWTFGT
jgi:PPOX class probable F420-dependent enzyme